MLRHAVRLLAEVIAVASDETALRGDAGFFWQRA